MCTAESSEVSSRRHKTSMYPAPDPPSVSVPSNSTAVLASTGEETSLLQQQVLCLPKVLTNATFMQANASNNLPVWTESLCHDFQSFRPSNNNHFNQCLHALQR
jgi:hypothetical protein